MAHSRGHALVWFAMVVVCAVAQDSSTWDDDEHGPNMPPPPRPPPPPSYGSTYGPLYIIVGVMGGLVCLFYTCIGYHVCYKRALARKAELAPDPLSDHITPAADAHEGEPIGMTTYFSPGSHTVIYSIAWIVLFCLAALPGDVKIWPYGFIPLGICLVTYFLLGYRRFEFNPQDGVYRVSIAKCYRCMRYSGGEIHMSRLKGVTLTSIGRRKVSGKPWEPLYAATLHRMRPHPGTAEHIPLAVGLMDSVTFDMGKNINAMISKFNGGVTVDQLVTNPTENLEQGSDDDVEAARNFCTGCGKRVADLTAAFCGNCGKALAAGPSGAPASTAPPLAEKESGKAAATTKRNSHKSNSSWSDSHKSAGGSSDESSVESGAGKPKKAAAQKQGSKGGKGKRHESDSSRSSSEERPPNYEDVNRDVAPAKAPAWEKRNEQQTTKA